MARYMDNLDVISVQYPKGCDIESFVAGMEYMANLLEKPATIDIVPVVDKKCEFCNGFFEPLYMLSHSIILKFQKE